MQPAVLLLWCFGCVITIPARRGLTYTFGCLCSNTQSLCVYMNQQLS